MWGEGCDTACGRAFENGVRERARSEAVDARVTPCTDDARFGDLDGT